MQMAKVKRYKGSCLHLRTLIKGRDYTPTALETVLPHSRATCQRKLADPKQFTVEDLILLSRARRISIEEIANALLQDSKN